MQKAGDVYNKRMLNTLLFGIGKKGKGNGKSNI